MADAFIVCPETARRAARTVRGHQVVGARVGAEAVGRTDRDDGRFVSGRVNLAVDFSPRAIRAFVARRRDDDDSGIRQTARGAAQRIVFVRIHGSRAETHVDDLDLISGVGAIRVNPIESGEQTRSRALALRVEHTQID